MNLNQLHYFVTLAYMEHYESGEATIYHATKPQSCNWYVGTGTGDLFI